LVKVSLQRFRLCIILTVGAMLHPVMLVVGNIVTEDKPLIDVKVLAVVGT
jgi:hypothetical protein